MPGGRSSSVRGSIAHGTPHRNPAHWRPRLLTAACAATLAIALTSIAMAQHRAGGTQPSALGATTVIGPSPRLEAPSVIISAPASETGLGITLGQEGALPANTYIRIRGMSPDMSLTSGHVIAPGAWAVPIGALPSLRIVVPSGASGKTDIHVALVAIDGGVIAEARMSLVVAAAALGASTQERTSSEPLPSAPPRPAASPAASPAAPSPPVTSPPPSAQTHRPANGPSPALSAADRERAEGFLARGQKLLASGNIASARLFFQRAAEAGLDSGALAMADTFDPVELRRLNAVGIHPDVDEARRWYEKARELGAGPAVDRRIDRLGGR